jgi:hypothetical protein
VLFFLQGLFAVKGAALGLAGGAGGGAADVHAGSSTLEIFVIGAIDHVALDVGLGLGLRVAGDHIAVILASLGKAVAAGVVLGVGGGAIHANALADTQIVLIVGAVSGVASQITHGSKPSFPAMEHGCFSWLFCPPGLWLCTFGEKLRKYTEKPKNARIFWQFYEENRAIYPCNFLAR